MSDPDEPEETVESLLAERVALELEAADLKEEIKELEDEVKDLIWQVKYRIQLGDIPYALDLLDRWK